MWCTLLFLFLLETMQILFQKKKCGLTLFKRTKTNQKCGGSFFWGGGERIFLFCDYLCNASEDKWRKRKHLDHKNEINFK